MVKVTLIETNQNKDDQILLFSLLSFLRGNVVVLQQSFPATIQRQYNLRSVTSPSSPEESTWPAPLPGPPLFRRVCARQMMGTRLKTCGFGRRILHVFSPNFWCIKRPFTYNSLFLPFYLFTGKSCFVFYHWSLCRFWPWLTGRKTTWIIKSCKNMFFCILDIAIANSMAVHRLQNEPGRVEAGTCQGVPAAKRKTRKDEEPSGPQPTPSIPCFAADDAPWVPWVSRSPVSVQWNVDPLFPKQHLFPTTKVGKSKLSYSAFLSSRETKTVLA